MKIDGRAIAEEILNELKTRVENLKEKGITPTLAIILVGDNPESVAYVGQKELKAAGVGVSVTVIRLKEVSENEILQKINELNEDPKIHGIIIQRPIADVPSEKLDTAVIPEKDVDGFNPKSFYDPPIAEAVIKILKSTDENFANKKIAVIGKGETGGGPIIKTFKKMGVDFTVIDSGTPSPELITKSADIIVSAVGKRVLKTEDIKKGVVLVSVGLSSDESGKVRGDYSGNEVKDIASYYSPTPGGVGPVNVAMLLENVVTAAEKLSS
jgi:methylenetetrahydrofolate dehydrogenase (NADP+) / methenyltetrahydrofolate cyclohydrolase